VRGRISRSEAHALSQATSGGNINASDFLRDRQSLDPPSTDVKIKTRKNETDTRPETRSSYSTSRDDLEIETQQSTRFSALTSTNLLEQLHWLPIEWRIRFKVVSSTYKAIHTGNPPYLADVLHHHKSIRFTRSSSSHLRDVPHHNLSFGSRAFRVSAPQVHNSIPLHICQAQTLTSFRRHLKTYYFQSTYLAPYRSSPMRPDSLLRFWRYLN